MNRASTLLLALAFLMRVGSAQDVPVPELETLKKEYASLVKASDGPHLAAVAELNKKYIARLEQEQKTAQQAGKLDEALAIDEEKKAVSSGMGVSVEDDVKLPGALKKMHSAYRAEIARLELASASNLKPLRHDYAAELDALVLRLTQDGKLKEALTVRKAREELRVVAGGGVPPVKGIPVDASIFKGHHYLLVSARSGWHDAKKECERTGGHLVTISNKEEDRFVVSLSKPLTSTEGNFVWIGCADEEKEGEWKWVDGSKAKYSGWYPGEPTDRSHTENYAGIFFAGGQKGDFGWGDAPSPYSKCVGYICEWDR